MFHELVESAAVRKQTRQGFAALVSAMVQSACLFLLLLLPLIYTQALPKTILSAFLIAPAPAVNRPRPAPPATQNVRTQRRLLLNGVIHEPTAIPRDVTMIQEPPLPPESPLDSQITEAQSGLNLLGDVTGVPGPGRPLPPAPPAKQRIQLGGMVQAAKIISQPSPAYPILARQARIEGDVVCTRLLTGRAA